MDHALSAKARAPRGLPAHAAGAAIAAAASGFLWAACHGARAFNLAPLIALVPLFVLLGWRRPFWSGYLHGFVFWLVSIWWMRPTLVRFGGLPDWLALACVVGLCAYLGLYTALFASLGSRAWRRSALLAAVVVPAAWVALETLRGKLLTGFPWNLAAYSATEVPGALAASAWVGPYGVSFLVVAVNCLLGLAVARRRAGPLVAAGAVVAVLGLAAILSAGDSPGRDDPFSVKLIQPNSQILTVWHAPTAQRQYADLVAQSEEACARGQALLIWPESAAWPFSWQRNPGLRRDLTRLAEAGCPVLFNSAASQGDVFFNSAYLIDAASEPERYDKLHLVPFGEYVPLDTLFPFLQRIARAAGDFRPGDDLELLAWRGESIGMSICFEIVFSTEVAERVAAGATVLVTITNDAWYGDTAAPWQHFRAAQFRAAENRRPVLRAALTGVSAIIDADGSVRELLGVDRRGVISGEVSGRRDRTLYSRAPWLAPVVCWLAVTVFLLPSFVIFWRDRRAG